jgi:hypothetical protein
MLSLILSLSFLVLSCSTAPTSIRHPQSVDLSDAVIPTPEVLFLVGRFMLKKPSLKPWYDDHYGEELDLSIKRPTVNLAGTVFAAKYAKAGTRLQANFFHDGKFYIARVPEHGAKGIYFEIAHFPPEFVAAHVLYRVEMESGHPIELVAEMPDLEHLQVMQRLLPEQVIESLPPELSGDDFKIQNVGISTEAHWTKEDPKQSYDLARGQHGAYLRITRFVSMKVRFKDFYKVGNSTTQIKMPVTKDSNKVLAVGLDFSEREGLDHLYSTGNDNCETTALDIYETATGVKDPRIGFIRKFIDRRIPVLAPQTLAQYGGIEVAPMHLDPTLSSESLAAYRDVIVMPRRLLCPAGLAPAHCKNLRDAEALLKTLRPNDCHALFTSY